MRKPRRRRSQLRELGGEISKVLDELGLDGAQRALTIAESWEQAVGPEIARHAQPTGMRGDVLELVVDSSVWAQQLQLQRPRLLAALAEALPPGATAPTELRFRVGGRPGRSTPRRPSPGPGQTG